MNRQTTIETAAAKDVLGIYQPGSTHMVGDGFPVRNLFPSNELDREVSPFLMLDYAGPQYFTPTDHPRGVGEHPHRGFETVTIVYEGMLAHRDSAGNAGVIGPGDVQWMTAGNGIVHEEFHSQDFTRKGGPLQMVQLWVNLRATDKTAKPRYQTLLKAQIPTVELPDNAGSLRVIAGDFGGQPGPAKTFSRINLWDVDLRAGKSAELALPNGHTTTFLVLSGEVTVNGEREAKEGDLAIFARDGDGITVKAKANAKLLVMDGEPFDEPVVGQGPFVLNSRAEIRQAFEDYQLGRMGEISA